MAENFEQCFFNKSRYSIKCVVRAKKQNHKPIIVIGNSLTTNVVKDLVLMLLEIMDEIMECPFNIQHRIIRHRMPYHIVKCKKNYKGPPLQTCPYNAMHMVTEDRLRQHIIECPDYQVVMQEQYLKQSMPATLSK